MAWSVRVFCTESRSKGVNTAQGCSKSFCFQLAANCEAGLLTKEVFFVVYNLICIFRLHSAVTGLYCNLSNLFHAEGCYLEHFSGTFTVAASDFRSVDVLEAALLEEAVYCKSHLVTNTVNCTKSICTCTKVCNIAQVFHRHLVFLQRIFIRICFAKTLEAFESYFYSLSTCRRFNKKTFSAETCSGVELFEFSFDFIYICIIRRIIAVKGELDISKAASIVHLNKNKTL